MYTSGDLQIIDRAGPELWGVSAVENGWEKDWNHRTGSGLFQEEVNGLIWPKVIASRNPDEKWPG